MKMKMILTLLAVAVVIASCNDSNDGKSAQDNLIAAKRNGTSWNGITEARLNTKTDTLTVLGISNQPNDEVIVFKIKLDGVGQYSLAKGQSYYYSTVGQDVMTSEYRIGPGESGILTVTNYNRKRGELEGSFEVALEKNFSNTEGSENELNFTEGTFTATIEK